jgi:hypothetical protein
VQLLVAVWMSLNTAKKCLKFCIILHKLITKFCTISQNLTILNQVFVRGVNFDFFLVDLAIAVLWLRGSTLALGFLCTTFSDSRTLSRGVPELSVYQDFTVPLILAFLSLFLSSYVRTL